MYPIINDLLGNLLIVIGMYIFSKIVLNKPIKASRTRLIIDLILSTISYTLIMLYFTGMIKTILMMIILFIFNKDIFKERIKKTVFITFLYTLLLLVLDLLVLLFTTKILNIDK